MYISKNGYADKARKRSIMRKFYGLSEVANCGIIFSSDSQKSAFELAQNLAKEESKTIVMRQIIKEDNRVVEIHTALLKADGSVERVN